MSFVAFNGAKGAVVSVDPYLEWDLPWLKWFGFKEEMKDEVPVQFLNVEDAPIQILGAEVEDIGTKRVRVKGIEHTFTAKVQNTSGRKIRTVQLNWLKEFPFESYSKTKYRVNSTSSMMPGEIREISFRLPLVRRQDAFYSVWVKKLLFEDGETWSREDHVDEAEEGSKAEDLEKLEEEEVSSVNEEGEEFVDKVIEELERFEEEELEEGEDEPEEGSEDDAEG